MKLVVKKNATTAKTKAAKPAVKVKKGGITDAARARAASQIKTLEAGQVKRQKSLDFYAGMVEQKKALIKAKADKIKQLQKIAK